MKHRKNAVYTGQSTRESTGTGGTRVLVDAFYKRIDNLLLPEDEIALIPPEQVNPTHNLRKQLFIVADYCIRKILPEITSLFHWGDKCTPQLRALAPIVNRKTVIAARRVAVDAHFASAEVVYAAHAAGNLLDGHSMYAARDACDIATAAISSMGCPTGRFVFFALMTCIEAEDEAAYNRIIALTNEMLEAL